ncbi:MAG: hypothetical protein Q9174_002372, partial [Haloplaca sp. 1 TL-2023]
MSPDPEMTMATSSSTSLETLPSEIKTNILDSMPDANSLRAIVQASPMFHATYLLTREKTLTKVTLQELGNRNIDVTTLVDYAEVCVRGGSGSKSLYTILEMAIRTIFYQVNSNAPIKLMVPHCIALLKLIDFKGFRINPPGVPPQAPIHSRQWSSWQHNFTCVTHTDPTEYLACYGWRGYKVLGFGA